MAFTYSTFTGDVRIRGDAPRCAPSPSPSTVAVCRAANPRRATGSQRATPGEPPAPATPPTEAPQAWAPSVSLPPRSKSLHIGHGGYGRFHPLGWPCGTSSHREGFRVARTGFGGGPAGHRRDSVRRVPRRRGGFGSWDGYDDAQRPARPARAPAGRPRRPPRHRGRSPAHSDLHSYARVVNKPPDWPPENGGKASAVHSPNTARMRIICDPAAARMQCVRVRCASGPHPYTTPVPQPFECHSSERGQERPCSHPISRQRSS